jgi:hypothetical protein
MLKAALVGAVALATIGTFSVTRDGVALNTAAAQEIVVTDGQIARLKSALRLTPAQERHWRPVEATLHSLARQSYRVASADTGFVARTRAHVSGYTVTAFALNRVRSAAQPLIATLSDEQKSAGMSVLQSMGISF